MITLNFLLIAFIIIFFLLGIAGIGRLTATGALSETKRRVGSTTAKETFYNDTCTDCNYSGWRRKDLCGSCKNCGWSVGYDGFGQCMPGYIDGPVTNLNTQEWYYGNKLIWTIPNPRLTAPISREINFYSPSIPRRSHIPYRDMTHQNRMRNDYGYYRYGKRFGYGWDPRYHTERY